MNVDHLVKMANEISVFFASESPPQQAPRDVAGHLRRFWEPRMRKEIVAHYAKGGAGLTDIALGAVAILAAEAAGATPSAGATPAGAVTPSAGTTSPGGTASKPSR
ncbi:MAG TPA: formate dehydrogenase subunit delta [Steroidobacteraceae bacterium]|nr:formate dehydrogenase subunit delta [Steroidobacteraceae bacterium]